VDLDTSAGICAASSSGLPEGRRIFWEFEDLNEAELPDAGVYGILDRRGLGVDDGGLLAVSVEDDFADGGGAIVDLAGGTVQLYGSSTARIFGHADVLLVLPDSGIGVLDFDFNATSCQ
jgi:hypothetical protein